MIRIPTDFWPRHRAWIVGCLFALLAACAAYVFERGSHSEAPTGSSLTGLLLGVIAAAIIVFELLLTWRKSKRGKRWKPTSRWMLAHIWLGLLVIPFAFLHSGWRFGGWFTTTFMIVLIGVILSGIVGVWLQMQFRQAQLEEVASETVYAEIGPVMERYVALAEKHLKVVCGPEEKDEDAGVFRALRAGMKHAPPAGVAIAPGKPRARNEWERLPLTTADPEPVRGSEALRAFFDEEIRDYMLTGEAGGSPLRARHAASQLFAELRARIPPAANETANALQRLCDIRRQLDRQTELHGRVHGWLLIHIPLAWALVPLLIVHIVSALRYW